MLRSLKQALIPLFVIGLVVVPLKSLAENRPLQFAGHLEDNGLPFEGSLDVVFTIYTHETSDDAVHVFWSESQSVLFENGDFTATLGANTTNALPNFSDGPEKLYLGIQIATDAEMTPRLSLDSVPFAKHAERAAQANYVGSFNETALSNIGAQATNNEAAINAIQTEIGTTGSDSLGSQVTNNTTQIQTLETDLSGLLNNVQRPHLTSCAEGYSIRTVDPAGNVICDPDDDTVITDYAGTGDMGQVLISNGVTANPVWQNVSDLGTIKVHRQIDGAAIQTQEKVNEVYMVDVTPDKVGIVQPLDHTILERLCKDDDGCKYTIHMINFSASKPGMSGMRGPRTLHLSQTSNWWRDSLDAEGVDGNSGNNEIKPWDCYITDAETSTNTNNGRLDNGAGFGVLNVKGGDYSDSLTTCRYIFDD